MSDTSLAIDSVYEDAKDFLIIGLTGRTGSGCSTAAKKLAGKNLDVPSEGYEGLTRNEFKKHGIIKKYIDGANWVPFYKIEASSIITYHLLMLSNSEFVKYFSNNSFAQPLTKVEAKKLYSLFYMLREKVQSMDGKRKHLDSRDVDAWAELYFAELPGLTASIIDELGRARFTQFYQRAGDNVRASGKANDAIFCSEQLFNFPKHLNFVIKVAHKKSSCWW
jgi:hypothetical protein